MEAFTRSQSKDLFQIETDRQIYAKSSNREDKFHKNYPKLHKSLSKTDNQPNPSNSLVPFVNPTYEYLDPLSENFQNFSLPRIRQLWCEEAECSYNPTLWADQGRTQRPSSRMTHHQPSGSNGATTTTSDSYQNHNRHQKRQEGQVEYYEEREIEDIRRGTKLKTRSNISPAASNSASNSTESTGISSSKNKRSEQDTAATNNSMGGQFVLQNSDFHNSFKSTNSRSLRSSNATGMMYPPGVYTPNHSSNAFCPSCNGVIPLSHLETIPEMSSFKGENGLWNFNNFHHPLQRDNSIGGFTLNGQPRPAEKSKMSKFCSSHKIALVVSTFSLLVTIGLIITLLFMKKKGMMEPM